MSVSDLRREYARSALTETAVDPDPFRQFAAWFAEAQAAEVVEANAMILATATRDGKPSVRTVLLKGFDERGFVFYTNYESRKGRELAENPHAALLFYWAQLERQIRVTGTVAKISREASERYFHSRPAGSQIGALASRQSEVIPNREVLEERTQRLAAEYAGREVPLPPFWGGYRVAPDSFEFWQGRPSRLHDRLRYVPTTTGDWRIERLSP